MKVIIFTAEPSNFVPKSLAKEAEGLGHEAMILDVGHCVIAEGFDKELTSKIYLCEKDDPEKKKVGEIKPLEVDGNTVVIPRLNEYNLEMKLSMLQRMADAGATILNSVHSMDLCNDKLMSQVTLNTAGIRTPFSFTMHNADDVEKMVAYMEEQKKLSFPTIVKTLRGTHGIGVMKIDSRSSLVSVAQMLLKEGIEFMVQEFIKHDQSARMIMIGPDLLAANLRGQPKDKDEFRTNSHLGSETEKYEPSEDELALGRKIVELFGCNFCAIDYIIKGKDLIVLEVNGSPGLEAISKDWPDKNLPKTVIEFATRGEKSAIEKGNEIPKLAGSLDLEQPVAPETPMPAKTDDKSPEGDNQAPENALHEVEKVQIHRIVDEVEARIDTGAKTSSLHVDEVEFDDKKAKFKRGNVTFTTSVSRTVLIKNVHSGDTTRRPVIKLDITINGERINGVEFTLSNRSKMKYQVLIGRNILEVLGLPVLVTKNDAVTKDAEDSEEEATDEDEKK